MVNRRKLLQVCGGVLASSSVPGCSYFDEERYTSILVENVTRERHTVLVGVYDPESDTRSELFSEGTELAPVGEEPNRDVFGDAFEVQRALVEISLVNTEKQRTVENEMQEQFFYQPPQSCKTREWDEVLEIQIANPYSVTWNVRCENEESRV